jgi:hypothetical protein
MRIEKVVRFLRTYSNTPSNINSAGTRLVRVSLPRVRFIEGGGAEQKYFRDEEITEELITARFGMEPDRVRYMLTGKKPSGS